MKYCLKCGFVGRSEQYRPGSFRTEVRLWLFLIVPAVIYSLGRRWAGFPGVINFIDELLPRYKLGTFLMQGGLWIVFAVPGAIYSLLRLSSRYEGCAKCGSSRIVPADSTVARSALARMTPTPSARSWVCMVCGNQIFAGGRVCPSCGAEIPLDDL